MSWIEDPISMLSKLGISFTWNLPNDLESRTLLNEVFNVVDETEKRIQDQLVVGCVQATSGGILLTHPKSNKEPVPCEILFTSHPFNQEFCVNKIVFVSEARNFELYVENNYEYTAKGIMLTIKKGKKASLFETEFDLTKFVKPGKKCSVKMLSFPDKDQVKLQAVILKVAQCAKQVPESPSSIDMSSVQKFLQSVGRPLSVDAQKMLSTLNQQFHKTHSVSQLQQSSAGSQEHRLRSHSSGSLLSEAMSRARQQEEEDRIERLNVRPMTPEEDKSFINMLATLVTDQTTHVTDQTTQPILTNGSSSHHANGLHDSDTESVQRGQNMPTQRWDTFLNSRLRASQRLARGSRPQSFVSSTSSRPSSRPASMCTAEDARNLQRILAAEFHSLGSPSRSSPESADGQSRCPECGCPGCLSVFNSVSTNLFAMEERIMSRVDTRMEQLMQHLDSQFNALAEGILGSTFNTTDHRQPTHNHFSNQRNCVDNCHHIHNTSCIGDHRYTPPKQNNCATCGDHQHMHGHQMNGRQLLNPPNIINTSV